MIFTDANPYPMKQILTLFLLLILSSSFAQTAKLYNPEANVSVAISEGLTKAKAANKHLLLQIGGNWCPWCIKFHQFCQNDNEISNLIVLKDLDFRFL